MNADEHFAIVADMRIRRNDLFGRARKDWAPYVFAVLAGVGVALILALVANWHRAIGWW